MKTIYTLLLVLVCGLWACTSEPQTASSTTPDTANSSASAASTDDAPVHIKSEKSALMIGLWHYAITVGKPEQVEKYKGRWIDIKRDNTFTSGIWLDETNSGTWSYVDDSNLIRLKFNKDEGLAIEWETLGNGETIIWKGSTPMNPLGTQIKMEKKMDGSRPAK